MMDGTSKDSHRVKKKQRKNQVKEQRLLVTILRRIVANLQLAQKWTRNKGTQNEGSSSVIVMQDRSLNQNYEADLEDPISRSEDPSSSSGINNCRESEDS
mmetsp:Transcript_8912/g.12954  ORF Transcript_8912/g.12954 Transcript_8912/m.12954 type:complete len:100 (+) Transcript_8912:1178-1477(+)